LTKTLARGRYVIKQDVYFHEGNPIRFLLTP
jgi:hypothetical protein